MALPEQSHYGILTPDQKVRVFISSTLRELQQERVAARTVVKDDLALHPIMFEQGASPHPPRERYRAMLAQSHIYIGIFWESYGWIAPDMDVSGIEDEFNLSEGKTRLVYVKEPAPNRDERLRALLARMERKSTFCYTSFETTDDFRTRLKNDIQLVLSESFLLSEPDAFQAHALHRSYAPPTYLRSLRAEMESRPLVHRAALVGQILLKLEETRRLALVGDPGIGKTYLLGQIGAQKDAIYVSLKGKTTQQVCAHVANHLALRRGQPPQMLASEDESREALESEFSFGNSMILFDHAEQNVTTAQVLAEVEPLRCRILFASRPTQAAFIPGVARFQVPSFTRDEIIEFLHARGINPAPGEIERIVTASQGNALYLDYFGRAQPSPMPQGLMDFQRALWDQLSPENQDATAFIAHSHDLLRMVDLHELTQAGGQTATTPIQLKTQLERAAPLLHRVEAHWEIFHPFFQEYVISEIARDGLTVRYHRLFGEHAEKKRRIVSMTFHFLRAEDPRADAHLEQAAAVALLRGEWPLAEEFLKRGLSNAQRDGDLNAQARHHHGLAQAYGDSGRRREARDAAQASMSLFEQLGDLDGKRLVELYAATLSMEEGASVEAIVKLREAAMAFHGADELMEAAALSNLSYVYLHTGFGEDAMQAAQRALDIFSRLGDKRGERLALLNLSAATGMSDSGDLEEQRALAEAVIAKADERGDLRLKAGGLNHLARAQRRAGNPAGAQRSTEEAIGLCQQIGAIEAELMNIANLGNALLDQERLDEAERAYQESLLRAREHGLKRQEAHCLELLARLKHKRGLYEESVLLVRQAVEMFEQLGDFLRIASTQDKLARSYACLGQKESAAQAYEASGKNYQVTKQWSDAACGYQQAAALWNELGRIHVAARCALQGAECAMHSDDPGAAANLLAEATNSYPGVDCLYLEVLKKLLSDNHPTSFSRFMINFASLCKARNDLFSKERFKTGIEMCVGALEAEFRAKVANALAVGLEQAQGLLPSSEVDRLAGLVADSVEHLHYRSDLPDLRTWTIGMPWKKPIVVQLVNAVDEPIGRRLAMAIALILLANEDALENTVEQFGGNQESGFMLQIFARKEVYKAGVRIESSANPNIQAFVPEINIPWNQAQPPTALIVDDRYDEFSDWSRNPGSKTFLWVLMNVFGAFVGHCSHRKRDYPGFAGKASEFCQLIF